MLRARLRPKDHLGEQTRVLGELSHRPEEELELATKRKRRHALIAGLLVLAIIEVKAFANPGGHDLQLDRQLVKARHAAAQKLLKHLPRQAHDVQVERPREPEARVARKGT